ncbi:MAG: dihydrolipoyl dehydrogenase [Myxococcota bacterium]
MAERFDAVVIGSGPGGYVAGIRLGQHGKKALVVEREHLGGVCLNWGCIPSKALIHAGNLRHEIEAFGDVFSAVPSMDTTKLQDWKEGIVKKQRNGVGMLLKSAGTAHMEGDAKLTGPHTLEVQTKNGVEEVQFDNLILATGAQIIEIPGFSFADPLVGYARDAVSYNPMPQRLVIIGGGIIGSELGTAYRKMGAEVTIVEMMDQILGGTDPDLVRPVTKSMKKLGINVLLGAKAKGFENKGEFGVVEVEKKDGSTESFEADKVLVAVGFKPNTQDLGLDAAGVETDEKGWVPVDHQCRTNVNHIFAIGDLTGPPLLAHRASHMGEVAAEVISGKAAAFDVMAMPLGVFTDPEVAQAGLTEAEAKEKGYQVKTGLFPMTALGRASAMNATEGVVKVVVDSDSDVVLGVGITAYNACDLIAEACLAIEMGALAEDLSLTVHVHPTLSEGLMEAAKAARDEPLHIAKKPKRDRQRSSAA